MKPHKPILIEIDTREQKPYKFTRFVKEGKAKTVTTKLEEGDYRASKGGEKEANKKLAAIVERKTLADLYGTATRGRERFAKELQKLKEYGYAAIVIEAELSSIAEPNKHLKYPTKAKPKSVIASLMAWSQRYHVHVWMLPGRKAAETITFRILERWTKDETRQKT